MTDATKIGDLHGCATPDRFFGELCALSRIKSPKNLAQPFQAGIELSAAVPMAPPSSPGGERARLHDAT